ncbi:MAG: hypothetical protein IPO79_05350 [Flavobacteriales bacterium]|nr:hypothetical protein [Flavobacteriales bacterium]
MSTIAPFKNIVFGEHSAEIEKVESPSLVETAYFDESGYLGALLGSSKFLILGTKGSGKSTLIQKIISTQAYDKQITFNDLNQFPFSNFQSAGFSGSIGKEQTLPKSWTWILVIQLLWSLYEDQGRSPNSDYDKFMQGLRQIGFAPATKFDDIVQQTRDSKSILHGPSIEFDALFGVNATVNTFKYDRNTNQNKDINFSKLVDYAMTILLQQKSENKHYILIDGLDRALFSEKNSYDSISALVSECSHLNQQFREGSNPFKIIIACRTDLFDKLPLYNSNAIRNTYSLVLDWHDDHRDIYKSRLIKLANYRAAATLQSEVNIFNIYFKKIIEVQGRERLTAAYILYHTRNTPRDLIIALKFIQESSTGDNIPITTSEIITGLTKYSENYFVHEVEDELKGHISETDIEKTIQSLRFFGRNRFQSKKFTDQMESLGITEEHATHILKLLFDASAIGNLIVKADGQLRPVSRHYSSSARLVLSSDIIVHRGLWKAFDYV